MLKELIAEDVQEPKVTKLFRASEVGECETYLCRVLLGHHPLPMSGRVRHMLADGITHEKDIVERLVREGVDVKHSCLDSQLSIVCVDEGDLKIPGHPDGLLEHQPSGFELDYAEEGFRYDRGTYLLEITAPNHFSFLRVERDHMRSALWRKYVQIQMYLNSEVIKERTDCCVVEVKNKNTSALYEEGVVYDPKVVRGVMDVLCRVQVLVANGEVSPYRCKDWRRSYCKFRHMCFGEEVVEVEPSGKFLSGESLSNAEELLQAAELWLKGKDMVESGEELVEDARSLFRATIEEYGASGLTVACARAAMINANRRKISLDIFKAKYPEAYKDMVYLEPSRYVRVTKT